VKRWWPIVVIVLVLIVAGGALYVDWTWKRKLSPHGGRPFLTRVELPVPSFQQGDDKWRDDALGGVPENGTLGGEGCAVAAAAMVFKFYGIDVDPQQLNWFLTATDGFTEQGWLYWDRAAWFAPNRVRHVYEDLPSYQLIDSNIAHGNPVIIRVRLASRISLSSRERKASIISSAIPARARRKGFIHCENLAAISRRCDFISRSRIQIQIHGCLLTDEGRR
jgi:Peptidase_C39 like family